MIYVTGDTHGDLSRFKLSAARKIKKRDVLIVCGDFGFVWDGGVKEKRVLKWLGKRRYDVLFADGAHENFDELKKYGEEYWCGGKTRKISGRLRMSARGQVFEIGGKRVFVFGGGDRDDGAASGGEGEKPTPEDFAEAMKNLEKADFKVDYVVSYEPPTQITEFLSLSKLDDDAAPESERAGHYLDEINKKLKYERWFFGRHHINKIVTPKYFALFDGIVSAESAVGAHFKKPR
ncbi:MAG: metallophosphoesterase [Oscillospiraceae bacterium]|jgi:predicted phosphodiesterase|nr:metallophosphoesterase [Oscillospiraceae bacterium]